VQRQVAPLFFQWTITGVVELEMPCIGSEELSHKGGHLPGKVAHDAVQPFPVIAAGVIALEQVGGGALGNVLVKAGAGLLLRQQKLDISFGKIKRCGTGKKNLAALKLVTIPARLLRRIRRDFDQSGGNICRHS